MHAPSRTAFALAAGFIVACLAATSAQADATFYEHDNYRGRTFVTQEPVPNFSNFGFNDRASSVVITSNRWEVCDNGNYGGRCVVLRPGSYPSLAAMGLNDRISSVRLVAGRGDSDREPPAAPPAQAAVTFYEFDNYQGRAFGTLQSVPNFMNFGFNDRASSIVVTSNRWEVCDDTNYGGRCVLLRPGNYPSLAALGLNNRVSSVRMAAGRGDADREPPTAPPAQAAVTFYEFENFQGRAFGTQDSVANFMNFGFNDRASSIVVTSNRWEVCDDNNYGGRCVLLRPGNYASLAAMGLNDRVSSVRMVARRAEADSEPPTAPQVQAAVTFYEYPNFKGAAFGAHQSVASFMNYGFNDRASSIVVSSSRWLVCDDVNFAGHCAMLSPGNYPSLSAMGLDDRISSLQAIDTAGQPAYDERRAPPPQSSAWRRRANERLYEANVTAVRAVVGPPEQRCWVEHQVAEQPRDNRSNVPGALAGALIGGIIGHQIGGGTGRDIATAGGVMAGAVVGSRINSDGQRVASQDVQRCRTVPGPQSADYWDVSYTFRGRDHRVQMTRPPGPTITVNRQGEPRV